MEGGSEFWIKLVRVEFSRTNVGGGCSRWRSISHMKFDCADAIASRLAPTGLFGAAQTLPMFETYEDEAQLLRDLRLRRQMLG